MRYVRQFIEFFLRKKWLGLFAVIAFFVVIGISTVYRGSFGHKQRTDLTVFFEAAEMIHEGRPLHIYGTETARHWHYVYSPFLAIMLEPFAQVPFTVSVALFYLLSFLCLLGTFFLSKESAEDTGDTGWKIALSAILCLPVFLNTLTRGQLGTAILFAQAVVFFCYLKGWKTLTGFLLAFAVAIKISPLAVLFFFFLFKKEWRILLVAAASALFFLLVYPSLAIGFRNNWTLLTTWQGLMSQGSSITAYKGYLWSELTTPFSNDNQALYAVVTRFVWPTKEIFIAQATNWVRWGVMACGAVSLLFLFLKRQPVRSFPVPAEDRPGLLAEYSLYPVLMLIFSPVTQIHHYTSIYFLFLSALLMFEKPSAHKKWLLAGIWACAVLFFLGYVVNPLSYWGMPMWGTFLLWGTVLVSLKRAVR